MLFTLVLKLMLRVMIVLNASDRQTLQHLSQRDPDWRVRERAQSLLLLAEGRTCPQVAAQQGLTLQTVSATRRRWLNHGLSGLPDCPRCGAPANLTPAETERLLAWARQEPLTLTALKGRHEAAGGTPVPVNTLTGVLKRGGFVWKRTRHRLKKTG
jgi:transposase